MPLYAKSLQRQFGVDTLVSNLKRRAAVVPRIKLRINRESTAGFVPPSVYIGIHLFVLPEICPGGFSSIVWRVRGTVVFWTNRPVGVLSYPAPLRPAAPPCAALPRPVRGFSGFSIRPLKSARLLSDNMIVDDVSTGRPSFAIFFDMFTQGSLFSVVEIFYSRSV